MGRFRGVWRKLHAAMKNTPHPRPIRGSKSRGPEDAPVTTLGTSTHPNVRTCARARPAYAANLAVHVEGPGDGPAAFTGLEPLDRFLPLMVIQLRFAAEPAAAPDGGDAALVGPPQDPRALLRGGWVTRTWKGNWVRAPDGTTIKCLPFDQILDHTEQAFVERMGSYSIEGQTACRSPEPDLNRCR